MPKVKNGELCPKGVKAVNTDFVYKNGGLSSEQMSLDFQCETEAAIKEEEGIEKAYSTLTEEISDLRAENDRILKGFNNVRDDIKKKSKHYHSIDSNLMKTLSLKFYLHFSCMIMSNVFAKHHLYKEL